MPKLTASQAAEKHARRLKGATEDIRTGVARVSQAPGELAATKVEKLRANWLAAVDNGKWAARVKSVPLSTWQKLMTDKGIPRIAAGVDGAKEKIEAFFTELLSYQESLQATVNKMPDLTLEDNISRMTTWTRGMSKFRRK